MTGNIERNSGQVIEVIEAVYAAKRKQEAWTEVFNFAADFVQARSLIYYHLPPFGGDDVDVPHSVDQEASPQESVNRAILDYAFNNLVRLNPDALLDAAFWSSDCLLSSIKSKGLENEAVPIVGKPFNGLTVPCYGPACRNGAVILSLNEETEEPSRSEILIFRWVAQCAHEMHCKLLRTSDVHQPRLTKREVAVLSGIASGKSNKEVAVAMKISPYTVNGYTKSIFLKLGTGDRTTAVLRGIKMGAIPLSGNDLSKTYSSAG